MARVTKYNVEWAVNDPIAIEIESIRLGGEWTMGNGIKCGAGLYQHYRNLITLLLGDKWKWNRWSELLLRQFVEKKIVAVIGPASSSKTATAAAYVFATYCVWPNETTVMCSSTTLQMLELRIWGEIKKFFRITKERWPECPGHMLEYKHMITTDGKDVEVREFRNGIIGIACRVGGSDVGLSNYVGLKNKRLILCADELQFMDKCFLDAWSNLKKNPIAQMIGLGNPKDPTDALGALAEPATEVGGWDGVDRSEKTKTWPTRIPEGICVQLVGTDSPNHDFPPGKEPFRFIIGREHIEADAFYYGRESIQFTMMNLGMMPRGGTARRVITRQMCIKFHALEEPIWDGLTKRTKVFGLDAAYGSSGGDRCVGGELQFGKGLDGNTILAFIGQPIIIPVKGNKATSPEDQIAEFVMAECQQRGIVPSNVFFDSTGRGTLMMAFARIWSPEVTGIEFGGRATERPVAAGDERLCRDAYGKFVTELWYSVRRVIEAGQFRGMPTEVMEEGCMREWIILPSGKVDVEKKDDTKQRMGRSPDLFDMLVAAVEGCRRKGFEIGGMSRSLSIQPIDWLRDMGRKFKKIEQNHCLAEV